MSPWENEQKMKGSNEKRDEAEIQIVTKTLDNSLSIPMNI